MNILIELFHQIKNGNYTKYKELIDNNPNLVNEFYYGVNPLMYSIECGYEDIALDLCHNSRIDLTLKDNLDSSPIEKAIEYKMYRVVEVLCRNLKKSIINDSYIDDVETYLTASIKSDDSNVTISLINGNADLNKPNKLKQYPIQLAIRFNKIDVVKAMLKANNIFIGTLDNGYNPLLDACENDLTEISLLLIENGADLNVYDQSQAWTPLMHAICNNNETIVSKLLENKCNIALVDVNGNTPVHLAVLSENEYILKLLLKHNAPKNLKNSEDLTPLDIAKLNEDESSIQLLK